MCRDAFCFLPTRPEGRARTQRKKFTRLSPDSRAKVW